MTRDELIASLDQEHEGGMLRLYHDAQHSGDLALLGRSLRRTQEWMRSWRQRYRDALLLPPGDINVPPAVPAKVPVIQPPIRPPITQPKPAAPVNGNGHYQPQKVK